VTFVTHFPIIFLITSPTPIGRTAPSPLSRGISRFAKIALFTLQNYNNNNDNNNNNSNSFIYPAKMNQLVLKEEHGINTCAALNTI